MKPIGPTQRSVLQSLVLFGYWRENCGWVWDNLSGTERIMQSLEARGLARSRGEEWPVGSGIVRTVYRPTAAGRRVNSESGGAS